MTSPETETETGTVDTGTAVDVRRAIGAICMVAAVHVAALVLILTHADVVRDSMAAAHPGVTPAKLDDLTKTQVYSSVVPHVLFAIVLPIRAFSLRSGRKRARMILTVLLALQLLAHATLPMILKVLPGYGGEVIAVQAFSLIFEVGALFLMWSPNRAGRFFR